MEKDYASELSQQRVELKKRDGWARTDLTADEGESPWGVGGKKR